MGNGYGGAALPLATLHTAKDALSFCGSAKMETS